MADRQHFSRTENFNEAQNKFKHLREYVNKVSMKEGIPEFRTKLDRSLRVLENPNIIYPVGDPIFVHISKNNGTGSLVYKVIMPQLSRDEKDYYDAILDRIIEIAHTAVVPNSQDELRDIIISLYNEVIFIKHPQKNQIF